MITCPDCRILDLRLDLAGQCYDHARARGTYARLNGMSWWNIAADIMQERRVHLKYNHFISADSTKSERPGPGVVAPVGR
jgi:hypothetical protein